MECVVCSEDVHRVLTCGCGFSACEECFKKWFISDPNEARCMSCKRALTLSWMLKNITTHWVNDTKKGYRSHLKETLLDKQTSLLQDTAGAVERYKAREALVKSNERKRQRRAEILHTLRKLKHQKNELESKCCVKFRKGRLIPPKADARFFCKLCYVLLRSDPDVKKYKAAKTKFMKTHKGDLRRFVGRGAPVEVRKLHFKRHIVFLKARHFCCEELRTLAVAIATCNNKLQRKYYNPKRLPVFRLGDDNTAANTPQEEKKEFIGGCPYKGCNGLVEARKFKCIVCEKRVCKMCLKPRKRKTELKPNERPHVCNKDDIASVRLIRNDTKQCPKCFVGIHKYEGCRTMFCTMCKTSFDYYSGEIIRDRTNAHNPHLIEWLRENGDLPTAPDAIIRCGVLPDPSLFEVYWSALNLDPIYRSVGHTHTFEDHIQEKYQQLRVDYILGKITKAKWKQSIFIHHRMIDRATIKNHILETFRHAAIERFVVLAEKIRDKTVTNDTTDDFILEMNALRELTNKNMRNELVFYGATVYYYCDASWKWCRKKM